MRKSDKGCPLTEVHWFFASYSNDPGMSKSIILSSRSTHVRRHRHRIVDLGKILFQRLHRLEQGDKAALAHGLDHQTVAAPVHIRFIARPPYLPRHTTP